MPVSTSGTTSLQLASVMFAGQVNVGAVLSTTVTVATQVLRCRAVRYRQRYVVVARIGAVKGAGVDRTVG